MASPELDYITVKGFKSIASVEKLALGRINSVIGPNGSGKSNFISVFSFLHAIRAGKLQDYVGQAGGAEKLLHFGSKTTKKIEIHISFGDEVNQYSLSLLPTDGDTLLPSDEYVYFWDKSRYPKGPYGSGLSRKGNEAGISDSTSKGIADWVRWHFARWRLYHFHDTSSSSP